MVKLSREGEWGAQCTPEEYVNMLEAEVDKRIFPSTQADFRLMEVGGF